MVFVCLMCFCLCFCVLYSCFFLYQGIAEELFIDAIFPKKKKKKKRISDVFGSGIFKVNLFMCDLLKVSHCYLLEMESFPDELQMLLKRNGTVLHPDVRLVSGISYIH